MYQTWPSIVLKLVPPNKPRLGYRYIWNRGRSYRIMGKLDPVKRRWIIDQMNRGIIPQKEIASRMGITPRYVRILYAQYKKTGRIPVEGKPGRPRSADYSDVKSIVTSAYTMCRCSARTLERFIKEHWNIHIPHNAIHQIMKSGGMAGDSPKKSRKRKWVRYERTYSNSMWHIDYKQLKDKRWVVSYMDDASRFITGYGVFDEATGEHAIEVLHQAIRKHGRPATILTDRGSQFYANASEAKRKGVSAFEQELVRLEIKQILARVNHPQTNGKLERFHGEIQRKLHLFRNIDDLFDWYNNIRPHMSLDFDNLETPVQAFARKMPSQGIVTDEQTGEKYTVSGNKGVWVKDD